MCWDSGLSDVIDQERFMEVETVSPSISRGSTPYLWQDTKFDSEKAIKHHVKRRSIFCNSHAD